MSRVDYNEEGGPRMYLWMAVANRTINGKRGQAILKELKAALEALPEKKLIYGQVCDGAGVCAVGTLALHRLMKQGMTREKAMAKLQKKYPEMKDGPNEAGLDMGMTYTLAWEIMEKNDGDRHRTKTDEDRYNFVLEWVTKHLKEAS